MKIAFITPWEETVPPKKYGGIELVVYNIVEQLTKLGHEVVLLGTGDSNTSANLVPIFEKSTRHEAYSSDLLAREANTFLGISRAVEKLRWIDADIVHNHLGWRFLMFEKMIKQPMVSTIHLSLDNPYEQEIYKLIPDHPFVSISKSQRKPLPNLHYIETVYNGIDYKKFKFQSSHRDYLAFLGSFVSHKGPDKAIEIAKKTNQRLIMAGKVDPLQEEYFNKNIKPHIDGDQIKFIGEVGHKEKNKLLGGAKALLMPISWDEPFGLVMAEAMACGTPVIAIKRGSTPELIDHGVDGFLCDNFEEMVNSVSYIGELDRSAARKNVMENFSVERMVDGYLGVYSHIISHHKTMPAPLNQYKKIKYRAKKKFDLSKSGEIRTELRRQRKKIKKSIKPMVNNTSKKSNKIK